MRRRQDNSDSQAQERKGHTLSTKTLKPSSQYDASRRKAPRRNVMLCQNFPARRYNFAWHLLLLRQVIRRRSE